MQDYSIIFIFPISCYISSISCKIINKYIKQLWHVYIGYTRLQCWFSLPCLKLLAFRRQFDMVSTAVWYLIWNNFTLKFILAIPEHHVCPLNQGLWLPRLQIGHKSTLMESIWCLEMLCPDSGVKRQNCQVFFSFFFFTWRISLSLPKAYRRGRQNELKPKRFAPDYASTMHSISFLSDTFLFVLYHLEIWRIF